MKDSPADPQLNSIIDLDQKQSTQSHPISQVIELKYTRP